MSTMPVFRYLRNLQVGRTVSLNHSVWADSLCHRGDGMVLYMAGLNMLRVTRNERHVLAFFILQADLPPGEELGPRLNVFQSGILEWSLELAAHNVFQAVVRDYVVMGTLVLYGDCLFHQTPFLELIAVNERSTEASLLLWIEALCKVGVDFARSIGFAQKCSLEGGILVLIIRDIDVVAGFGD